MLVNSKTTHGTTPFRALKVGECFYPDGEDDIELTWLTYDNYIKPNCIVKIEKENNKMEAKKCDRCGKLYEKKFNKTNIECIFKHQEPFFEGEEKNYSKEYIDDQKTHGVYIRRGCGDHIDMCPECRESFKKWFEEG